MPDREGRHDGTQSLAHPCSYRYARTVSREAHFRVKSRAAGGSVALVRVNHIDDRQACTKTAWFTLSKSLLLRLSIHSNVALYRAGPCAFYHSTHPRDQYLCILTFVPYSYGDGGKNNHDKGDVWNNHAQEQRST